MKVQGVLLFLVFSVASANPRYFGCSAPHIINPIPTGRGRSYALPPHSFFARTQKVFERGVSNFLAFKTYTLPSFKAKTWDFVLTT